MVETPADYSQPSSTYSFPIKQLRSFKNHFWFKVRLIESVSLYINQIEEEKEPLKPKSVDSGIPIPSASPKATPPRREFYYTYVYWLYNISIKWLLLLHKMEIVNLCTIYVYGQWFDLYKCMWNWNRSARSLAGSGTPPFRSYMRAAKSGPSALPIESDSSSEDESAPVLLHQSKKSISQPRSIPRSVGL